MRREAIDARQILELRGLPAALDIERNILGGVLVDGAERLTLLRGALDEKSFYLEANRKIWDSLCTLQDSGKSLDRVSLAEQLKSEGKLESIGGLNAILGLDDGLPQTVSVDGWIRTLQEKALLRATINRLNDAMVRCLREDSEALSVVLSAAEAIQAGAGQGRGPLRAREIIESIGIQEFCQPSRNTDGIPMPERWPSLRDHIRYLRPGQLVIVAALTSRGKSTFVAQLAIETAMQGYPVAVFSMEMGAEEVLPRMASCIAGVDSFLHETGRMNQSERTRFLEAAGTLCEIPLDIDDRSTHTIHSIAAAVRQMKEKPRLIVVDYLQLVESVGKYENRAQAVSDLSRGLKRLAGELRVPIIALSQLSRKPAQEDRRPELHDLRDSGAIEQDANTVIFLHTTRQNAILSEVPCEVVIAKNRGGRLGNIPMLFKKATAQFVEDSSL